MIIYQVLPRLFGNDVESPVFNGSILENGCGRMNDFTLTALKQIKTLGATHIWFTGLIEHATQTDYSDAGIARDHSAMVKGKAGSPYAIKDYYDVDPDLASVPKRRMREFEALVERSHSVGLKFIMDFVPNHVARQYFSDAKPEGVRDLGAGDNEGQAFSPSNNFYYIPSERLACRFDMTGVEGSAYVEMPAKATGNDCFVAHPSRDDWYETVKLNYGVDYLGGRVGHFSPVPDTWLKILEILRFWAAKGVDGFRCDMAEMVPVEFWDWALRRLKAEFEGLIFIGEVYNPLLYREFIYRGHFDYLYDKVGLYDTLRAVIRYERPASDISCRWQELDDIRSHMLYFLENHDEQRLASPFFAGDGMKGIPALCVCTLMGSNPYMHYFGQEFGERGMDREGFSGEDGRTTIFDYWRVGCIQRWRNRGHFTLKYLEPKERELYALYKGIMRLSESEAVFREGCFYDLMYANYQNAAFDAQRLYAFVRATDDVVCFVICNFSDSVQRVGLNIPLHAFEFLSLNEGCYVGKELMTAQVVEAVLSSHEPLNATIGAWSAALLMFER